MREYMPIMDSICLIPIMDTAHACVVADFGRLGCGRNLHFKFEISVLRRALLYMREYMPIMDTACGRRRLLK